ncbi:MAG: ChaN family lipoprotein [Pseudomonadota bacterium]
MSWIQPSTGDRMSHPDAIAQMASGRVVLLGEQHDLPGDHRFQELALAGLAAHVPVLEVGFEMFPRFVQPILDRWVSGRMSEAAFLQETRWEEVWGFPPELYLPIFRVCRDLSLPMVALNVPRPLVSKIGRDGWSALPPEDAGWFSPAVPASAGYRRYLFEMTGGRRPDRKAQSPDDPAFDRFVRAQQVWDRSFACTIVERLAATPGAHIAGIIGRGHLEYRFGVVEQLASLDVLDVIVALPSKHAPEREEIADLSFVQGGNSHTVDAF